MIEITKKKSYDFLQLYLNGECPFKKFPGRYACKHKQQCFELQGKKTNDPTLIFCDPSCIPECVLQDNYYKLFWLKCFLQDLADFFKLKYRRGLENVDRFTTSWYFFKEMLKDIKAIKTLKMIFNF